MISSKSLIHCHCMDVHKSMTTIDLDFGIAGEFGSGSFAEMKLRENNPIRMRMKKGKVALKPQL
jgi:hypothetical protein